MRRLAIAMSGGIVLAFVAVATHPAPAQGAVGSGDRAQLDQPAGVPFPMPRPMNAVAAPAIANTDAGAAIPE